MEKGLMYGLIGIGVALVIAVGFVVLAVFGPSIKEKVAEKEAASKEGETTNELQTKMEVMDGVLQDLRHKSDDQERQIDTMNRSIDALPNAVGNLKTAPPPPPPEEINISTNQTNTSGLNIYDLSTITKDNCLDAVAQIREAESKARNDSLGFGVQIDEKLNLKVNLTNQLSSLDTNASNFSALNSSLTSQIKSLDSQTEDLRQQQKDTDNKRQDLRQRRRDIETKCKGFGLKVT